MIQDIYPLYLNNSYQNIQPTADSLIISFSDGKIFLKNEEQISYLTYGQLEEVCGKLGKAVPECRYIFSIGEEKYFLAQLWDECEISGFSYRKMFETRAMKPKEKVFAAATAWHLYVWYRDNRFCGRCGQILVHSAQQRMLECPCCANQVYPKISVAVIVGVTDGSRILMSKYANREYKRYALIAGFTEIGETAEETVKREVAEEVGLHVKNIRYYKSQPWGYDSDFLLGYFCELDGTKEIHLDENELSLAEWVDYKDIPDDPEGLSLTREMMLYFRDIMSQKTKINNKQIQE